MKKLLRVACLGLAMAAFVSPAISADISPMEIPGVKTVNAAQAKELFDKGVMFLDVRKDSDWDAGRVPEAEHLDSKKKFTEASFSQIAKKDQEVVIYCNGEKCLRSSVASAKAVKWGYTKLSYFRDGFPAWKAAGYPTE